MRFLYHSRKREPWFALSEALSHRNGWRCKIFRPQGGYYKGIWKDHLQSGQGVQFLKSGFQYEGEWFCNKKNGFGVLSKYDADEKLFYLVYVGDFKNDKKHGFGSLHYEDGTYYYGEFKCDKRHGYGKCWFADGSYYEGCWANDLQNGHGLFIQANGNRYEGEWLQGEKNGIGEFYHLKKSQIQVGFWKNEMCIVSQIEDLKFRQSAVFPTPYPIPKSGLYPSSALLSFLDEAEKIIYNHNAQGRNSCHMLIFSKRLSRNMTM